MILYFAAIISLAFFSLPATADVFNWWRPKIGTTWDINLSGNLNLSLPVQMFIVDFDEANANMSQLVHDARQRLICYINVGAWESFRDDALSFPQDLLGLPVDDAEGGAEERWVDIRSDEMQYIVRLRLDHAVVKGCDGVDFGNVDGYDEDTGFDLTYDDQLAFNKWLADEAHRRNLTAGFHNNERQYGDLVDDYDFVVIEGCRQWNVCNEASVWIDRGKPVFGLEFRMTESAAEFCPEMNKLGFSFLQKAMNSSRIDCLDSTTWQLASINEL